LFKEIREKPDYKKKIMGMMQAEDEPILFLEEIIAERGLLVVIDENSDRLQEVIDNIAYHDDTECCVLEFARFKNESGQQALLLDTLHDHAQYAKENTAIHSELTMANDNLKQLHEKVEKAILSLGNDIVKKPTETGAYFGFWRNNKMFAVLYNTRAFVRIGINAKSSELNDPDKIAKSRGRGSVIEPVQRDQLDYVMKLVKQAYDNAQN
jgi:predicted transport protein